jgi:hypothetical protein
MDWWWPSPNSYVDTASKEAMKGKGDPMREVLILVSLQKRRRKQEVTCTEKWPLGSQVRQPPAIQVEKPTLLTPRS